MQVESKVEAEPAALKDEDKSGDTVRVNSGKTAQVLLSEEEDSLSLNDFHNNDNKVLQLLNEAGSNYSFKGLMRKLGLHQQSLSRALHRLEEMGLVEKTADGYRLGTLAHSIGLRPRSQKRADYMQLLQTYIPVNVKPAEVVRRLIGKWFKNLRWLGMIEIGTGYTLQWASDDGTFQINLRLISDYIIIETDASTEKEKVQAMAGSYAIYQQITRVLQNKVETDYLLDYRNDAISANN